MSALRNWRRASGLTIDDAADRLCVSSASLSRIERGEQWPDREFFARLHVETHGRVTANDFIPTPLINTGYPVSHGDGGHAMPNGGTP